MSDKPKKQKKKNPETTARANTAYRGRMKAKGFKQVVIWIDPADEAELRAKYHKKIGDTPRGI